MKPREEWAENVHDYRFEGKTNFVLHTQSSQSIKTDAIRLCSISLKGFCCSVES